LGPEDNYQYKPQTEIPEKSFRDLYYNSELSSLQRVYKPLKEYLPEESIDKSVQTSFYFFRSKNEK